MASTAAERRERDIKRRRAERQRRKQQERALKLLNAEAREAARGPMDTPLLVLTLILQTIGLVMLLSASFPAAQVDYSAPFHFFIRQGIFVSGGIAAALFISKINYHRIEGLARLGLLVSVALLVLVLVPGIGLTRNHATRWLGIPGFEAAQFQPSEVAKMGIIIYFAESISKKKEKMKTWREGVVPYLGILMVVVLLMLKEPHFSGALLILGIGAAMMVVGGVHWGLIVLGVIGLVGGGYAVLFTDLMEKIGYNSARIAVWRDPFGGGAESLQGVAWQTTQSLITIGSGGLLGVGLGKSRQKFMYLPEAENDFIFAVVFEELGLVGATLIMILFAMLIIRGYWIAIHARDRFGSLLAVGVTTQIALQTFLNMAVVTNLVPNTGISLPFFSYGGTALLIQFAEIGIVLAVSRQMSAPISS